MPTKNYEQELADMQSGLNSTIRLIEESTNRKTYDKALKNKKIQECQIDFFKRGYKFARRELGSQKSVTDIIEMNLVARQEMIKEDIQETITPMKICVVCDIARPVGLFIRPCGKETTACLICRGGGE